MKMKRILILVVGFLMVFCFSLQAGEIERIKDKGEIIVSLNTGYVPFSMEVKGERTGLDVDLARLIAQYLGVKVKFLIPQLFGDQIPKLLAGESDIIIAAMTRTPERGLLVDFTDPYFEVSQAALVRRDLVKPQDESLFDLVGIKGIRVGVREKTTGAYFAKELFPPEAIKTYPGHPESLAALLKGEVDATVHDSPLVEAWVSSHPELWVKVKPLLAPVTKETFGFAIRKGDLEFLTWLNLFISQVQSDGTMDLLKYRYFVEMPWMAQKPGKQAEMTKAQLLRNEFMKKKQEKLEGLRKEEPKIE
jgi:polar amino acid transport system substrate-binding protein